MTDISIRDAINDPKYEVFLWEVKHDIADTPRYEVGMYAAKSPSEVLSYLRHDYGKHLKHVKIQPLKRKLEQNVLTFGTTQPDITKEEFDKGFNDNDIFQECVNKMCVLITSYNGSSKMFDDEWNQKTGRWIGDKK